MNTSVWFRFCEARNPRVPFGCQGRGRQYPRHGGSTQNVERALLIMVTEETLRLRQRDGKRIGFILTRGKSFEDFLLPLKCAVLSATTRHGFALTAMVEILQLWRTYELTQDQNIYKKYLFLKTAWQNTWDGVDEKSSYAPNLHMLVKNNQDP